MSYHRITSMACPDELIGFGSSGMRIPDPDPRHSAAQRMADIWKIPFIAALACMDRGAEIERGAR